MADLRDRLHWWKAKEVPFIEWNWRSIQKYFDEEKQNVLGSERCVYVVRMSPPFSISYGDDDSPLLYVGSGHIGNRWSMHRTWLHEVGLSLPGARYEVWVCAPRVRNNPNVDDDVEAEIIERFCAKFGVLPLRNQRIEHPRIKHEYGEDFFRTIWAGKDKRYRWAVYPIFGEIEEFYNCGWQE